MVPLTETYHMVSPGALAVGFVLGTVGIVAIFGVPFLLPVVQTFRRQPADAPLSERIAASEWVLGAVGVLMLAIAAVLGGFFVLDLNVAVVLEKDTLRIEGGSFDPRYQGQSTDALPLSALRVSEARVLRDRHDGGYGTSARTSGLGLPGLLSGWFRLQNGQKAFVYLVQAPKTVLVPTTEGYTFLFDVRRPHDFLQALRRQDSPGEASRRSF
jgi:hypothetical protein